MSSQNPNLTKALSDFEEGSPGDLVRIALGARMDANEGLYCDCSEPLLIGDDLLCGACLLNNRDQEVARLHLIVDAHDFTPGHSRGARLLGWCHYCSYPEPDPRHHGVGVTGETSWGTEVVGKSR